MSRRAVRAGALAAMLTSGACGTTFVDESVATVDTAVDVTVATTIAIDSDLPLDELLSEIEMLMFGLAERIVEQDAQSETFARVDALWRVAEDRIRDRDPDDLYNFEQAIELARTGVERRRPADASKGYKIIVDVIDVYLERN